MGVIGCCQWMLSAVGGHQRSSWVTRGCSYGGFVWALPWATGGFALTNTFAHAQVVDIESFKNTILELQQENSVLKLDLNAMEETKNALSTVMGQKTHLEHQLREISNELMGLKSQFAMLETQAKDDATRLAQETLQAQVIAVKAQQSETERVQALLIPLCAVSISPPSAPQRGPTTNATTMAVRGRNFPETRAQNMCDKLFWIIVGGHNDGL